VLVVFVQSICTAIAYEMAAIAPSLALILQVAASQSSQGNNTTSAAVSLVLTSITNVSEDIAATSKKIESVETEIAVLRTTKRRAGKQK
jgi:hypothetical protein